MHGWAEGYTGTVKGTVWAENSQPPSVAAEVTFDLVAVRNFSGGSRASDPPSAPGVPTGGWRGGEGGGSIA